jgi:hypothetical protein
MFLFCIFFCIVHAFVLKHSDDDAPAPPCAVVGFADYYAATVAAEPRQSTSSLMSLLSLTVLA